MDTPTRRPSLGSAVIYKDPIAAVAWLERAFGFERAMMIYDREGHLVHSELRLGTGYIMVGAEWAEFVAAPPSVGGKNTQMVHIHLVDGIDAHCTRARDAGAAILQEPTEQFYGDRTYRARDPEGHVWTFGQTVREVTRAEAEKVSGLKIEGWT